VHTSGPAYLCQHQHRADHSRHLHPPSSCAFLDALCPRHGPPVLTSGALGRFEMKCPRRSRRAQAEETHEAHFASMAPGVRARLERIQQEVECRVPGAQRCISYKMPAFRQRRVFFYFAAFKKHIGVYPPVTDDVALMEDTARFRGPKGNLSFPLNEALPLDLIGRVAEALSRKYA